MPGAIHVNSNSDCTSCRSKACTCGIAHHVHAHETHSGHFHPPHGVRPSSCTPPASHAPAPQIYYPAPAVMPNPDAPYVYNQAAPYHCQPHACGPHAACAPIPCGPAHAHTHPAGNCHDVSLLLGHLNELAMPAITYACAPHPPLSVCLPEDVGRTPTPFTFDARLVRDELHHPLLCYLAEGVSPGVLTTGLAGTKMQTAARLLAAERPDGYRALQCVVYGHILLSLNVLLLEDAHRNSCIDTRRLWTVTSPCAASPQASSLELRVGGLAGVALEVHPTTVVSNSLMDAILAAVKSGSVFDATRGRVVADPHGDPFLHVDALALLTQVWARFAKDAVRKDASMTWVVLSNLERTIVFRRHAKEIKVSHIIKGDGISTPRDSCQNFYSLLLALSVLEKHQYHSTSLVELVQLL